MTTDSAVPPRGSTPTRPWLRLAAGLLLTPALVGSASLLLRRLSCGEELASLVSFTGAAGVALFALAVAAKAEIPLRPAVVVAAGAAGALGVLAYLQSGGGAALLIADAALVGLAWALGSSLGRRVQHASHLFPACVVAASADVASLLSPEGPSHAVANSDRALAVLAIWFPVPGSDAAAPALGVGDLLFVAFALALAHSQRLPYWRAIVCCALGIALAGFAAARLRVAVPALVPIAAALVLGLPEIRRLRKEDRRAAHWSMLIAVTVAMATLARRVTGLW